MNIPLQRRKSQFLFFLGSKPKRPLLSQDGSLPSVSSEIASIIYGVSQRSIERFAKELEETEAYLL